MNALENTFLLPTIISTRNRKEIGNAAKKGQKKIRNWSKYYG